LNRERVENEKKAAEEALKPFKRGVLRHKRLALGGGEESPGLKHG